MQDSATSYSPRFDCSYFIVVEDENGCSAISATYYYGEMAARIGNVVTYPNPATDLVTIEFDNDKNQFVKFDLIDNNGVKVEQFITTANRLEIDLGNYPSGIYYISFDATHNSEGCLTQEKQNNLSKIILNK